jgi:hypothetical protein
VGSIPYEVIGFFKRRSLSSRNVVLGLTQPLAGISTTNLPAGKERPTGKTDSLTSICEPIVWEM